MNTLSKEITRTFYKDENSYHEIKARWAQRVQADRGCAKNDEKKLNRADHLLAAALLGRNWQRGFRKISNRKKLDGGMRPNYGIFWALNEITATTEKYAERYFAPYRDVLAPDVIRKLRQYLPSVNLEITRDNYRPDFPVSYETPEIKLMKEKRKTLETHEWAVQYHENKIAYHQEHLEGSKANVERLRKEFYAEYPEEAGKDVPEHKVGAL